MSEEQGGVRKTENLLLLFGAVLVLLAVGTRVYIAGAEEEAQRLAKHQFAGLSSLENLRGKSTSEGVLKATDAAGQVFRSITSDPPGALILTPNQTYPEAPPITPTLVKQNSTNLSFETKFHQGAVQDLPPSGPIALSLKPLYRILVNLLWPGLLMLGAPFVLMRKSRPEPVESRPSSRTFVSSPSPAANESGSITRVVEPPQPPQVSQIFSLVEGPYQHDPATPEQLIYGRFIQGEVIGKGGMGTVYRCQSCVPGDKGRYALKVLLPEWSKSQDFRARFEREADICHKLTHRNLVRAYERGEKDGDLWMVMDFVQGSELNQWLQKQKRSPEEIVGLFLQICEGLSHAHQQDIVHRDLKPENILVTEDGQKAVIADFGLAKGKHYATITKTNTTLGTPIYMPPEQISGNPGGPLGDLYSLGCILYESLSGSIPFPETDVLALLNSKLNGKSPPALTLEQATPELRGIVEKLMAHKPEDRFQSAEELKDSLILLSRESNSSGS